MATSNKGMSSYGLSLHGKFCRDAKELTTETSKSVLSMTEKSTEAILTTVGETKELISNFYADKIGIITKGVESGRKHGMAAQNIMKDLETMEKKHKPNPNALNNFVENSNIDLKKEVIG